MSIYDPGPVITHEGAGLARAGTQSQPRKQGSRKPADRVKPKRVRRAAAKRAPPKQPARKGRQVGPHKPAPRRGGPVVESESNANSGVASFHTSQVNAPLGYQGLFQGH